MRSFTTTCMIFRPGVDRKVSHEPRDWKDVDPYSQERRNGLVALGAEKGLGGWGVESVENNCIRTMWVGISVLYDD